MESHWYSPVFDLSRISLFSQTYNPLLTDKIQILAYIRAHFHNQMTNTASLNHNFAAPKLMETGKADVFIQDDIE